MIKRVAVAGCRQYENYEEAKEYIELCISEIRKKYTLIFVSGGCRGADALGERYAAENGLKTEKYPADWEKYGRAAGPMRNKKIAEISDYIICFWDGQSKGTKSLLRFAEKSQKPVKIKFIKSFLIFKNIV